MKAAIASLAPDIKPRAPANAESLRHKKFCDVALGLVDEIASRQAGAIDVKRTNLDPDINDVDLSGSPEEKRQLYALYQHLPTGEYFTSAASLTHNEIASMVKGMVWID
jgi:hypothetical protein